ncbi:DHA2 family efflux MFS transporter permease subunit [Micromonospora sp. NPDC048935]|uniref:DHA2 family efflux MFS transporter permease subunit n=1 Tax=Micromonospora sp. NPDC048935 TaxID=3364262 RepID=UPI00372076FE
MSTVSAATPAAITRHPRAVVVLATAQFLVLLSTSIVNVALPSVRAGLNLSAGALTWVVNAYVLAFGALLLLGGRLADVVGQRRTYTIGLGVFLVATLAAGFAPTAEVLLPARAGQGVGAALLSPAALALLLRLHPGPEERSRAVAVWGGVSAAGGAAGVLLGGVLTDSLGWRWVFLAAVPLALAALLPAARVLPADEGRTRRSLDVAGAALVTVGVVLATYAVVQGGADGWLTVTTALVTAAAVAALVAFVVVERRQAQPLLPLRLFANVELSRANVAMALLGTVWVGLFVVLPLYQQQVLGWSPLESGVTQLPLALANIAAAMLTPRIVARVGAAAATVGALLLLAVGLAWLGTAGTDGTFLRTLLGPTVLIGLGIGAAFVLLTDAATTGVAPGDVGVAGGLVNTTRQVGGAIGLAAMLAVAKARTSAAQALPAVEALAAGYRAALLTAAVVALLAAAVSATGLRRRAVRRRTP